MGIGAAVLLIGLGLAIIAALAATGSLRPGSGALGPPRFTEVAAAAGVAHTYDGDYPYVVGGGVAAFDCDDDRLPDLYVAGGSEPAALYRNETPAGAALRFTAVKDPVTDLDAVTGAYPLDIDGDRHTDLAVLRIGGDVLLRGLGDCRFERANETFDVDGGDGWTVGFSASWETPAARLPTLAFGAYLVPEVAEGGIKTCADSRLVRPAGDTARTYAPTIPLSPGWCALSVLFSDWDRSGRRDLRVSNDRHYYRDGEEQLWRIAPGEPPRAYTEADGWQPVRIWGMGIASQDVTGDAYPEVYLTSQGDNKLQALVDGPAQPMYEDVALEHGVTAHRPYAGDENLPSTAWHPAFEDVNDDGFVDLYVSKGNVDEQLDYALRDPSNLLLGQPDGMFIEAAEAAGIMDFASARGAALVDLDLDGRLDIVQVVRREPVRIWHNGGTPESADRAHWLGIELDQDAPNHDAIGAWLAVRVGERITEREVTVGGGHASGTLGPIHVGLGPATSAEIRVTWPDGEVGPWQPVAADQYVTVRRGAPEVEVWSP